MHYANELIVCYTTFMLPNEFIDEIQKNTADIKDFNLDEFIQSYDLPAVKSLRINTLKGDIVKFLSINDFNISEGDVVKWCPTGFYYDDNDANPCGKHPYHSAGVYYIQEASAMAPVEEMHIEKGDMVLDLCASPGGKSTQIATHLGNEGLLVCNEPVLDRARILSENIERMGIGNAVVLNHKPEELSDRFAGFFDKILVDAPCSGEGMFRKNNAAISEWSIDNVKMCSDRQKYIFAEAVKMLKPGGRIVYSTCTFSKMEDEENAEYFVNSDESLNFVKMHKIWPHKEKGEGHFLAVFEKESEENNRKYVEEKGINEKEIKEFFNFESEVLKNKLKDILPYDFRYVIFGEDLYALHASMLSLKGLKVLRPGLHLGKLKKGRFEPAHAFALFLNKNEVKNCVDIDLNVAKRYLHGETFNAEGNKGFNLICIDGYSLGWGKLSNDIMKNHYPKGLRSQW